MENNVYRVIFTEMAETDLNEIYEYIATDLKAPIAAMSFTHSLEETFNLLAFLPNTHPKVRDYRLSAMGYRWLGIKNYMAFYTIDEQIKTVTVERILYGRRDWAQIL